MLLVLRTVHHRPENTVVRASGFLLVPNILRRSHGRPDNHRQAGVLSAANDLRHFCSAQNADAISKTAFERRPEQIGIEKDAVISRARGHVLRAGARLSKVGKAYRDGDISTIKK